MRQAAVAFNTYSSLQLQHRAVSCAQAACITPTKSWCFPRVNFYLFWRLLDKSRNKYDDLPTVTLIWSGSGDDWACLICQNQSQFQIHFSETLRFICKKETSFVNSVKPILMWFHLRKPSDVKVTSAVKTVNINDA